MSKKKTGDTIALQKQDVEVVKCKDCGALMVNLDVDELHPGDLKILKRLKVRISNPETEELYCLKCDLVKKPSFREKLSNWFESDDDDDDDDDSSFFRSTPTTSPTRSSSTFGGSSSGGGFGGFGGGGFSGGGASRSF